MTRIFVSMPEKFRNKDTEIETRKKIFELVSSYLEEPVMLIEGYRDTTLSPLEVLGESIKRMSKADYVVFMEGYENAEQGRIEYAAAREYGKRILVENAEQIQEIY